MDAGTSNRGARAAVPFRVQCHLQCKQEQQEQWEQDDLAIMKNKLQTKERKQARKYKNFNVTIQCNCI